MSKGQVLAAIKEDYQANYFVTGTGELDAYEDDCLFTDPFTGFRGTQRFKKNVGNFGGFLCVPMSQIPDCTACSFHCTVPLTIVAQLLKTCAVAQRRREAGCFGLQGD